MISEDSSISEGAQVPLSIKEIRSTQIFTQSLIHSPNGCFVTVVGDGEYITYTALAWQNKSFRNGISFAWMPDSNMYAMLENKVKPRIYKNFRERGSGGMKGSAGPSMGYMVGRCLEHEELGS
jgi:coatomer subunit beta'